MNDDLERQIDHLLAPLGEIPPADRNRGRAAAPRHRVIGAAVVVCLVVIAVGATWATIQLAERASTTPVTPPNSLSCLRLIGGSAKHADTALTHAGYQIRWRLLRYQPPNGKTATVTSPPSVPDSAIVENVASNGPRSVIVLVHLAGARFAPRITTTQCHL